MYLTFKLLHIESYSRHYIGILKQNLDSWSTNVCIFPTWYSSGLKWLRRVLLPLLSKPTTRTLHSFFLNPNTDVSLSKNPMSYNSLDLKSWLSVKVKLLICCIAFQLYILINHFKGSQMQWKEGVMFGTRLKVIGNITSIVIPLFMILGIQKLSLP